METGFFPPNSLSDRPDLHRFVADWFGKYLEAMGEVPLFPPGPTTMFRCLCLPTFDRPSVVRIESHGLTWLMCCKRMSGDGGFTVGVVDWRVDRTLTLKEAARVAAAFADLRFWESAAFINDYGLDGTTWLLEGVSRGTYHAVRRWEPEPNSTFGRLCTLMLELGNAGTMLERFRRWLATLAGTASR